MAKLFRRVLVPHDLSAPADAALRVAADLAAERGGRLQVLYALPPFDLGYATGVFPAATPRALPSPQLVRGDAERDLAGRVRRVVGRRAVPTRCTVVFGEPLQAILDAARDADTIVIATHGRTGLAHLLIGSVAEKVVRHAPVPVLTVRAAAASRRGAARRRAKKSA
jgi:universal stress protein A